MQLDASLDIFRELLVLDPRYRDVYNCHPYHFTEICIPLCNKVCRFHRALWDTHLKDVHHRYFT